MSKASQDTKGLSDKSLWWIFGLILLTGLLGFILPYAWVATALLSLLVWGEWSKETHGDDTIFSDNYYKYFDDLREAIKQGIDNGWHHYSPARIHLTNRLQYDWLKEHRVLDGHQVGVVNDTLWVGYVYTTQNYEIQLYPKDKGCLVVIKELPDNTDVVQYGAKVQQEIEHKYQVIEQARERREKHRANRIKNTQTW